MAARKPSTRSRTVQPSTRRTDTTPEPPAPASLGLGAQNVSTLNTSPVPIVPPAPPKRAPRKTPARTTKRKS